MVTNIKERANAWLVDDTDCYYSKSGCGHTAEIIRDLLAEVERLSGENANLVSILESDEASVPVLQSECCELATKLQAAQALAARHLADQDYLCAKERKRVARECIGIIKGADTESDAEAYLCGYVSAGKVIQRIRTRYGVEE